MTVATSPLLNKPLRSLAEVERAGVVRTLNEMIASWWQNYSSSIGEQCSSAYGLDKAAQQRRRAYDKECHELENRIKVLANAHEINKAELTNWPENFNFEMT